MYINYNKIWQLLGIDLLFLMFLYFYFFINVFYYKLFIIYFKLFYYIFIIYSTSWSRLFSFFIFQFLLSINVCVFIIIYFINNEILAKLILLLKKKLFYNSSHFSNDVDCFSSLIICCSYFKLFNFQIWVNT